MIGRGQGIGRTVRTGPLGTAAAILLPLALPAGLLVVLALTLDGGEAAFSALTGQDDTAPLPWTEAAARLIGPATGAIGPLPGPSRPPLRPRPAEAPPAAAAEGPPAIATAALAAPVAQVLTVAAPDQPALSPSPPDMVLTGPDPVIAIRLTVPVAPPPPDALPPAPSDGPLTTAAEVRGVLDLLGPRVLSLRPWEGQDQLSFGQLAALRCGITRIRYGLNGAAAETDLMLEPCHVGTPAPNRLTDLVRFPVAILLPGGSVTGITLQVTLDDGSLWTITAPRGLIAAP
jgi:hypothetical protein